MFNYEVYRLNFQIGFSLKLGFIREKSSCIFFHFFLGQAMTSGIYLWDITASNDIYTGFYWNRNMIVYSYSSSSYPCNYFHLCAIYLATHYGSVVRVLIGDADGAILESLNVCTLEMILTDDSSGNGTGYYSNIKVICIFFLPFSLFFFGSEIDHDYSL